MSVQSGDLVVTGGRGGTQARLEDLHAAVRALVESEYLMRTVVWRADESGRQVERARGMVAPELLPAADIAAGAAAWVRMGAGGTRGVQDCLLAEADRLRAVVAGYERAEAASGGFMHALKTGAEFVLVPVQVGNWLIRHGLSALAKGTELVSFDHRFAKGEWEWLDGPGDSFANWLRPEGGLPLQPWLNTDLTHDALKQLSRVPYPGEGNLYNAIVGSTNEATALATALLHPGAELVVVPYVSEQVEPVQSVEELVRRLLAQYPFPAGKSPAGSVGIEHIVQPDGSSSWIIFVPGTQTWSMTGDTNSFDGGSNGLLAAGRQSDSARVVLEAMRQAGIPSDDPVMMVGHSQGGMIVNSLVTTSSFMATYNVTTVATAGAPPSLTKVPTRVNALHLEHDEGVVSGVSPATNGQGANETTVRRSLRDSADPADRLAATDTAEAHSAKSYVRTATMVDASSDPSLLAWQRDAGGYFAHEGATVTHTDYQGIRATDARDVSIATGTVQPTGGFQRIE